MERTSRTHYFRDILGLSGWRLKQAEEALFQVAPKDFRDISVLPKTLRERLHEALPFVSYRSSQAITSLKKDTVKAWLEFADGKRIETVLMRNARGHATICVSSQVGCAMRCAFCATGTMGFTRNLTSDEIVDQYRYWRYFLSEKGMDTKITNIVYMGMGEPLANYEEVRESLRMLLAYSGIGPTHITVSTVGMLPRLESLLHDPLWPPVRLAVSLHSADPKTRADIMPTSFPDFLEKLAQWASEYFRLFDSKRRHLTFEYVMLSGINDTDHHADCLIRFARRIGHARVNLIPYNTTSGAFSRSLPERMERFQKRLKEAGVIATLRKTMGDDIAAACGQLVIEKLGATGN